MKVFTLAVTFLALAMAPTITMAQDNAMVDEAKAFVDEVGQKAMTIIQDDSLGKNAAKNKFRSVMSEAFDIPTIARFTLGRYWRTASEAQQTEYTQLVEDVILNKYADRLLGYSGDYSIDGARALNDTDTVVTMTVKPKDQANAVFAWRVRNEDGIMKIIDLAVEGVSMSVTHRSDFNAIIQRNGGDVQSLIDALQSKKAQ